MGPFYTPKVETLWMGFMTEDAKAYNGILIEFFFDVYKNDTQVKSTGVIKDAFPITGNFKTLFSENSSRVGIMINNNSEIDLGVVDFRNSELINSFAVFLQFKYTEDINQNFLLFERGVLGENGNFRVYLVKETRGRVV